MANPATGATTTPTSNTTGQNWGTQLALNDPTIGTNLSSGGDNNWLTSFPWSSAITTGVALEQAGAATRAGQNLTNAVSGAARPQLNLGNATIGQMTGGPSVGGPMGQYITGATGAAQEQLGVAATYGTGNLTPAQQQQVRSYSAAQKGQVASQLASGGNLDSSTRATLNQEVDNNAAMLTQQLVLQNQTIAQNAMTAANNTYTSMLTNSLAQTTLGTEATMRAVQMQLQNDQQVQGIIQQILSGIATQATTASGGQVSKQGGNQPTTPGGQLGAAFGKQLNQWFGGPMSNVPTGGVPSDLQTQFGEDIQSSISSYNPAGGTTDWSAAGANAPALNLGDWQGVNIDMSGTDTSGGGT